MDRYSKFMHTGLCNCDNTPIPGRRVEAGTTLAKYYKVGSTTPSIMRVRVSFDQFMNFMMSNKYSNLPYVLHFIIYDEAIVRTREECMLRFQFLKYLNNLPNAIYDFYLSDSALPAYISFMNTIGWKCEGSTTYHMSLDRNPVMMKNMSLECAKGKLDISEEKLLWVSDKELKLLPGKVDGTILSDVAKLKKFVLEFVGRLNHAFDIDKLNDFDIAYIAYHYLFDYTYSCSLPFRSLNIRYADGQTYRDEMGIQRLKRSSTNWESRPVGTLEHKKGVCTGQARLFNSLLCNPYIVIPAKEITGDIPSGEKHCWSNFVINDKIYQCCTTMRGIYEPLSMLGYKADPDEYFTFAYPHDCLTAQQMQDIKEHIKKAKK